MNYLDPYNFYFELPLYTTIEINAGNLEDFQNFVLFEDRINGYNPSIKEQTTFSVSISRHYTKAQSAPTYFDKTTVAYLKCLRTDKKFEYYFTTYKKTTGIIIFWLR